MKINGVNRIQGINKYRQMEQMDKEIKQQAKKKDQLSISDEAKILLENTKQATSKERVDEIKEKINNGTYEVAAEQVADKLLKWFNK